MDFKIKSYTNGTFLSLVKAIFTAFKTTSDVLYNKIATVQYELKFNSQKILLQRYLNDQFDDTERRIWIRANSRTQIRYKYRASEWTEEFTPNYKYRFEEIDGETYEEEEWEDDVTSADQTGTKVVHNHGLDIAFPIVVIYDNDGYILAGSNYVVQVIDNNNIEVDYLRILPGTYHIIVTNDYFVAAGEIAGTLIYKYRAEEMINYAVNNFDVMVPEGVTFDTVAMAAAVSKYAFPWLSFSIITY